MENSFTATNCFGGSNKRKTESSHSTKDTSNLPNNQSSVAKATKRKSSEDPDEENNSILRNKNEHPMHATSPEKRLSKLYKFISNDKMRATTRGILKKTHSRTTIAHSNNETSSGHNHQEQQGNRLSDNDPTYGFASRYSDSKSYFKAHNVDTTIPNAMVKREDLLGDEIPIEGGGNFRDILFPLRASNGSNKSHCGSPTNLRNNFTNIQISSPPQKKRVKFDDSLDALYEQPTFEFQRDMAQGNCKTSTSLREKIYDFFANLF